MATSQAIQVVADTTRWQDVRGYSTRQKQALPLGGFTGSVTLHGELEPILPYLAWGQLTHVGKEAIKGNGWYQLSIAQRQPQASSFALQ